MVNRRTIEALIRAGAFDTIAPLTEGAAPVPDRHKLLATVGVAWISPSRPSATPCRPACSTSPRWRTNMRRRYVSVRPWNEKAQLMEEKTALGFFFSGHPYNSRKKELSRFIPSTAQPPGAGQGIHQYRRYRRRHPHPDDPARQDALRAARRRHGDGRSLGVQRIVRAEREKIVTDEVLVIEGKVRYDEFQVAMPWWPERLMDAGRGPGPLCQAPVAQDERQLGCGQAEILAVALRARPGCGARALSQCAGRVRDGARRRRARPPRRCFAGSLERLVAAGELEIVYQ